MGNFLLGTGWAEGRILGISMLGYGLGGRLVVGYGCVVLAGIHIMSHDSGVEGSRMGHGNSGIKINDTMVRVYIVPVKNW